MINILLLILKIIGIILAAVLVLILLVLIYPIRYTVKAQADKSKADGQLTAYWLFHILHFKMNFGKSGMDYTLRLIGIPIMGNKKGGKSSSEKKKKEKPKKTKSKETSERVKEPEKSERAERPEQAEQAEKAGNTEKPDDVENTQQTDGGKDFAGAADEKSAADKDKENNKREENKKSGESKDSIKDRVLKFFKKIKSTIKRITDSAKSFSERIKKIKDFITANTTKEAYNYGKKIVKKLIHHIFPRKITGRFNIGFDSPDKTGKALGYVAVAYSTFGTDPNKMEIIPDFENEVFQGNIKAKGHIQVGVVVYYILRFYFNKDINKTIKRFNRL